MSKILAIPSVAVAQHRVEMAFRSRLKDVIEKYKMALKHKWGSDGEQLLSLLDEKIEIG